MIIIDDYHKNNQGLEITSQCLCEAIYLVGLMKLTAGRLVFVPWPHQ
jgi:hypothetical protein